MQAPTAVSVGDSETAELSPPETAAIKRLVDEISSTRASVMVRGTPALGSSTSPSRRSRKNRVRHLATVFAFGFEPRGDDGVSAVRARHHDAGASGQTLRGRTAPRPALQRQPLGLLQVRTSKPGH
ncbi:hypothetical protein Slala02_64580 [Streptomyces lavendulae subsp. lavendulae]|nr:hypothetical protein Slala01_68200 [Streptomyces lavendulae subsp. lavendulae]GLX30638.1 hypothetical protein Slala02_64580 [Streptomyces lavendulae subsp. lavendulae]